MDTFIVAAPVRGKGFGRRLISKVINTALKNDIFYMRLQTEETRDAYKIYKHWGFTESKMVHMKSLILSREWIEK